MIDQLALMHCEYRDGGVLIRLSGEIDLSNVESLQTRLERAVEGCAHVVVDLTSIAYIDSQGLRLLKRLSNTLHESGAQLEVVAPPDTVARDVLEMTKMGDDISICDSLAT
jgi:anti-anti-sigma factor